MTCHSCVKTIEDTMGEKDGIKNVSVDLQTATGFKFWFLFTEVAGRVVFDTSLWSADKVVEAIDDMGFNATLISVQGRRFLI